MKKLILVLIFCLATIATKAQGGDVKGAWTGKLNVYGTELTEEKAKTSDYFKFCPNYYIIGAVFHK